LFSSEAVAAVFHHSGGLPRLINTICDNALITAYARRLPTVTPDIIEDVAKEFRLNRTGSLEGERIEISNEMCTERVTNPLRDLYATLRISVAGDSDLDAFLDVETRKHEPYI
jgi:general secretion pathway protein A